MVYAMKTKNNENNENNSNNNNNYIDSLCDITALIFDNLITNWILIYHLFYLFTYQFFSPLHVFNKFDELREKSHGFFLFDGRASVQFIQSHVNL